MRRGSDSAGSVNTGEFDYVRNLRMKAYVLTGDRIRGDLIVEKVLRKAIARTNEYSGRESLDYKLLEDGRRQLIAFFLPGDVCDLNIFVLREMDHSIGAISASTIAEIPRPVFEDLTDAYPRVTQALL